MPALIDNLLNLLREHSLVKSVRIVNYDETPAGKLELKIRCRLVKDYQLQVCNRAPSLSQRGWRGG